MESRPASARETKRRLGVRVDQKKCCGFGFCWETSEEIFQIADSGIAYTTTETVPDRLVSAVRRAEERCPQEAVRVWELDAPE